VCEQSIEQPYGDTFIGTSEIAIDEHFAKRAFALANVDKRDGADDLPRGIGHPEITSSLSVVAVNIGKIGLVLQRDWDTKFFTLDAVDQSAHSPRIFFFRTADFYLCAHQWAFPD
jgi:hypothetical protein